MRSRMRPYYRGSDRTKDGDIQRRPWREGPHPRGTADRRPWFGLCAELPRRSDWRLCAELRAGPHRLLADVRPEGGARCVSSARRDLCGGRGVILVPTATIRRRCARIRVSKRYGMWARLYALMLAARITLPHFSVVSASRMKNSAGVSANAVQPKSAKRALILGSARAAATSLLSLSTIAVDVSFGAPTPNSETAS